METLRPFTIHFDQTDTNAQAVRVRGLIQPEVALDALGIIDFSGTIVLHGGASNMSDELMRPIQRLFREGLVPFADDHNVLVVYGGTHSGTMAALDAAYAEHGASFPLIGICPLRGVSYPGHPLDRKSPFRPLFRNGKPNEAESERFPLAPHSSHFILIEQGYFGVESRLIAEMIHARGRPGVSLLINGGQIARREVISQLHQSRPVITVAQSGRFADQLAHDNPYGPTLTSVPLERPDQLNAAFEASLARQKEATQE